MPVLSVGDRAPDVDLPGQDGRPVSLAALLAAGPVVLFFYPAANTAGCTREACHFRDLAADFAAVGARPVGVSTDTVADQQRFGETHALGFPLLSDVGGAVARAFGVERGRLARWAPVRRRTFVIGTDGHIRAVIGSEIDMKVHADEALRVLAAAA